MMPSDQREQEHIAFLYELYTRSAGDARQGVPYGELIDALGFSEHVTKRIQRELQLEGLVNLITVPPMTHVARPVMDHEHRYRQHQTIGITAQGIRVIEDILATPHTARPQASASRDQNTAL